MAEIMEKDLVTRVRQRADMVDNYFVGDSEVQTYLNAGIAELHDLLIQTYGQDYYVSTDTFTTVAGTSSYPIASSTSGPNITNFYKLRGMDAKLNGSEWFTLEPFNFSERNLNQNWGSWGLLGLTNVRYRLVGSNIEFIPEPDGATDIRIWYIPTAQQFDSTTPATSTTKFDDINGYAEYVVISAAINCLQKEESDVGVLLAQKLDMRKRIEQAASNRDAGSPITVTDVYKVNNEFFYTRST